MNKEPIANTSTAIVIPAFNEQATIKAVVTAALQHASIVIVIDDSSHDKTLEELVGLPITLLKHTSNQGKAASLYDGFMEAIKQGAKQIISLDGDYQHDPHEIPRLIAAAHQHPNKIIIAARLKGQENAPRSRYIANRIADFWISWAAGYRIVDCQSGFRLYPAELFATVKVSHQKTRGFVYESEILIAAAEQGYRSVSIAIYSFYPIGRRSSHFNPINDIFKIVLMVANNLLRKGMNFPGLYQALWGKKSIIHE